MEKVKYTIIGVAPEPIQKKFIKIKEKFNISSDKTKTRDHLILKDTAHFAIKRTFYLPKNVSEEQIIDKIKELSIKKLTIRCSNIGNFQNTAFGDIVYLGIDKNINLQDLHERIKNKIDPIIETKNPDMEGENYLPHLSVAYNVSKEIIADLKSILKVEVPLEFDLNQITLIRDSKKGRDEREIVYIHKLN